jgi:hypothetical protein
MSTCNNPPPPKKNVAGRAELVHPTTAGSRQSWVFLKRQNQSSVDREWHCGVLLVCRLPLGTPLATRCYHCSSCLATTCQPSGSLHTSRSCLLLAVGRSPTRFCLLLPGQPSATPPTCCQLGSAANKTKVPRVSVSGGHAILLPMNWRGATMTMYHI